MTTDPFPKAYAVEVDTAAGRFRVGGMAKGSGMIEPRMATMLGYLTTDADADPAVLRQRAGRGVPLHLQRHYRRRRELDQRLRLRAGQRRERRAIDEELYPALFDGFRAVAHELCAGHRPRRRRRDQADRDHRQAARGRKTRPGRRRASIANSPLVKTAMHGGDPNWGRLSRPPAAPAWRSISTARRCASVRSVLFSDGEPHDELAPQAAEYLQGHDLEIEVNVGAGGSGRATIYTCDLSAEYVKINAEYRT